MVMVAVSRVFISSAPSARDADDDGRDGSKGTEAEADRGGHTEGPDAAAVLRRKTDCCGSKNDRPAGPERDDGKCGNEGEPKGGLGQRGGLTLPDSGRYSDGDRQAYQP